LNEERIRDLLQKVRSGKIDIEGALAELKDLPFEDLGYAKVDHHRALRRGQAETILCTGKTVEQIKGIVLKMLERGVNVMATRANQGVYKALREDIDGIEYHEQARMVVIERKKIPKTRGKILVISAGTSDIPVAEEAVVTADVMGNTTEKLYDVGVAGIHRLLLHKAKLDEATVLIIVAGMDGALPSVVAGLSSKPVIAVPTSVGYGASFGGLSALLTMLNSCTDGVSVVNIDNGYGAGYCASIINHLAEKRE